MAKTKKHLTMDKILENVEFENQPNADSVGRNAGRDLRGFVENQKREKARAYEAFARKWFF